MKTLLALLLLSVSLTINAATLTASDNIGERSFVEFIEDQSYTVGPAYAYLWVPNGVTRPINGVDYTGPCWVVFFDDYAWNTYYTAVVPGYTVEIVEGVALGTAKVNDIFYDTWNTFLKKWRSLGGKYSRK